MSLIPPAGMSVRWSNPYRPPRSVSFAPLARSEPPGDLLWLFFSFQGRIGRLQYWMGLFSALVLAGFTFAAGVSALNFGFLDGSYLTTTSESTALIYGLLFLYGVAFLPIFWISMAITVKRWHDLDRSGLWYLIAFIPYAGPLWTLIECGCLPGTEGPNRYGPDPSGPLGPLS